jgi:TPR repeat protein
MRFRIASLLFGAVLAAFAGIGHAAYDGDEFASVRTRGVRGDHFLALGMREFQRGNYASAKDRWEVAAYWGQKVAQYNLGLMYYKGVGVPVDRPRGVAWIALSSERGEPALRDALARTYATLAPDEVERANALWNDELKPRYGDKVAMPRALSLWRADHVMTTGSHTGHVIGPLAVNNGSGIDEDGMQRQKRLAESGEPFGNPIYPRVEVGDLMSLDAAKP